MHTQKAKRRRATTERDSPSCSLPHMHGNPHGQINPGWICTCTDTESQTTYTCTYCSPGPLLPQWIERYREGKTWPTNHHKAAPTPAPTPKLHPLLHYPRHYQYLRVSYAYFNGGGGGAASGPNSQRTFSHFLSFFLSTFHSTSSKLVHKLQFVSANFF